MLQLVAGLALFIGAHLFSSIARGGRSAIAGKIGEMGYKGLMAILSLGGLYLIVQGWQAAGVGEPIFVAPAWLYSITYILVWIAFILTTAAYVPAGKIAAVTKHPMLAGTKVWATAHLLVNGDARSLILFGSLLAWAVITRIAVKKRGDHGREAGPVMNDLVAVGLGTIGYIAVFVWIHPYIAGVRLV